MIAMALGKICLFQIAGKVNRIIRELGLRELGQLEQDLVFGDAGMKDVIKFLNTKDVRNYIIHIWTHQIPCNHIL